MLYLVLCVGLDPAEEAAGLGPYEDLQQQPGEMPSLPLPPQLLNLFKLGEKGEEVRPFGEAT